MKYILYFSFLTNFFCYSCSSMNINSSPAKDKTVLAEPESTKPAITKIVYQFGDSSVPPKYHRSYEIVATDSSVSVVVDSYGDILAEKMIGITRAQFDSLIVGLDSCKLTSCSLPKNEGCTGGKSYSITVYSESGIELSGTTYRCGGSEFGNLCGDILFFASMLKSYIPDFSELVR